MEKNLLNKEKTESSRLWIEKSINTIKKNLFCFIHDTQDDQLVQLLHCTSKL